ncbi:hypothetical protein RHSIM_Rhsim13G0174500 [Rhododendron simsii]|uniref:Enoyl reductase (ER) domain-containing protein n=1 Tax=Rhododendron simsii TaxID=118357 RepID=A0A834L626_RHOSS|nr:hypothetical protein RHSIM_Rhsim13G0174500 [Rhododendron simsii]
MKAVVITTPGGPEVLQLQEVEDPEYGDDDVLIRVAATALNRADTIQRKGSYPPPKGTSPFLGLECSGTVEAVGRNVTRWKIGDQVCALLSGGGYAEKVAVPTGQVLPVPAGVSLKDAASFPEVACTVWSTVFMMSRLSAGETFLIHGGSSGIGTFAIQIAKYLGAKVFVTAGSKEKLAACKDLGADVCINYKSEDFVARVKEETQGKDFQNVPFRKDLVLSDLDSGHEYTAISFLILVQLYHVPGDLGVDVILDNVGGPYFQRNIDSLNMDGRLFIIGFMGGTVTEVNLQGLLARRLTVQVHLSPDSFRKYGLLPEANTFVSSGEFTSLTKIAILYYYAAAGLRYRSTENKALIVSEVDKNVWPAIVVGKVKPVVYKCLPLSEAAEGHRLMESSNHIGKILLLT